MTYITGGKDLLTLKFINIGISKNLMKGKILKLGTMLEHFYQAVQIGMPIGRKDKPKLEVS